MFLGETSLKVIVCGCLFVCCVCLMCLFVVVGVGVVVCLLCLLVIFGGFLVIFEERHGQTDPYR